MKNIILYFRDTLISLLKPSYDEITIFLISFTFIVLFLMDVTFRASASSFLSALVISLNFFGGPSSGGGEVIVYFFLTILFIMGLILSIYHAFTKRNKGLIEKELMLFFVLAINVIIGVFSGIYMLKNSTGLLIVFPLMNIINSVILVYQIGWINVGWLLDVEATLPQIIIGIIAIIVIFIICHFIYNLYWAITFSICVTYATNFSKIIQKYVNLAVRH